MESYTLNNGLKIVFNQDNSKHSALFQLCVKYGGNYNKFNYDGKDYVVNDGMAHLIEHLMIERSIYGNLLQVWGEHHMDMNGGTYTDKIVFWVDAVDDKDFALESLLLGINTKNFDEQALEITKKPVLREVNMTEDRPNDRLWKNIFKNSNNERIYETTIGTKEYVSNFTFDEVNCCIDSFFNPSNEILVVSGNFDKDNIIKRVEEIYNTMTFTNKKLIIPQYHETTNFKHNILNIKYPYHDQTGAVYHFRIDATGIPKDKLYSIVNMIYMRYTLTYGEGTEFSNKLKESGIIDSPYAIYVDLIDNIINVYLLNVKTTNINKLNKYINQYRDLTRFSKEEFELFKRSVLLDSLKSKSMSSQALNYIDDLLAYNLEDTDETKFYMNMKYEDLMNLDIDTSHKCLIKLRDK